MENHAGMNRKFFSIFIILASTFLQSEMINLECTTQNGDRSVSFNILLGTETGKAVQILKKGQLRMDLSITDKYFDIGQFTDESKTDLISVMKINIETLEIEYAKYMELVEPILCIKL